jgi:hypothetical protein
MKNNTEDLKKALQDVLRLMPQDFALQDTTNHLRAALASVNRVEGRRNQQATQQKQMETFEAQKREKMGQAPIMRDPTTSMTTSEARMVIKTLDQLIANEKKNLANILEQRSIKARGGNSRTNANPSVQTLLS